MRGLLLVLLLLLTPALGVAQDGGLTAFSITNDSNGTQTWSLKLQALFLMTALTLLPAFLLMMTSFTRIVIVLGILRTAIGTAQTPSNQILIGLALFLTLFIMEPVIDPVWHKAAKPYMSNQINAEQALSLIHI